MLRQHLADHGLRRRTRGRPRDRAGLSRGSDARVCKQRRKRPERDSQNRRGDAERTDLRVRFRSRARAVLMRRTPRIDLGTYLLAIPLLLRNPELMAVPLLSGIVGVALARFLSASADILGLGQLIQFLLDAFALAVSIILADMAWRRGRGSFDDAWTDARRKAGDILLTAIGLNFIIFVADFAGRFLGTYFEIGLDVIAIFFMIFALPAVAIGGIPGGAALQISIDRVRQAPVPAGILTVVFLVLYFG